MQNTFLYISPYFFIFPNGNPTSLTFINIINEKLKEMKFPNLLNFSSFSPRAANEARTRDPQLGKLMLYQLSYCRKTQCKVTEKIRIFAK